MLLTVFCWISLILFIGLSAFKAYKYAKMPFHGRLDLYPVPKESKERMHYGGSYMEDQHWWQKERKHNLVGEIIDMLAEMLLIKKLFIHQNSLWWISYSLHLGIYAAFAWTILIFAGAIIPADNALFSIVTLLTTIAGAIAGILMTAGALGLLAKRIFVKEFKIYTTPQEYFNLVFLLAVSATGVAVWLTDGMNFDYGRNIAKAMITFQPIEGMTTLLAVHIILLGAVMMYIPLTKMSHYVGKYFSFHKVIWDNDPNLPGSKVEAKIRENAKFKPNKSWSAPHFQPEPKKED